MSTRNIADWNGPHRLVNSMTRFRLCRSRGRATDHHSPKPMQPFCRPQLGPAVAGAIAVIPRSHRGSHLFSALLLFSAVLFLSAVLFFSAGLRGSGAFRGPD